MNPLNIFKNLGYEVIPDPHFGEVIQMSAEDAFDFSSIVGSNYLIGNYGVSMKGRNEVFIHRSLFHEGVYIYSPGLFGRDINRFINDQNTGPTLKKEYPQIFSGKKKVCIYNLAKTERSNIESDVIKQIVSENGNPEEYVLFKFNSKDSYIEPFMEWVCSRYFIKKGYIFENQCPFFQQSFNYKDKKLTGGIPDISAIKSPDFNLLSKFNIVGKDKGVTINKISNLINFNLISKTNPLPDNFNYELIIGEVKCTSSGQVQALKQLNKYESVDLANELFTLIPDCENNGSANYGSWHIKNDTLSINPGGKLTPNFAHQKEDAVWFQTYLKINLLANLPIEIIREELSKKFNGTNFYSYQLIDYAISLELEDLLNMIVKHYGIH